MGIKTSKIGGLKSHQKLYGNILVGLSFMALTFLVVKTFAPDVASNAETNTVQVNTGPYISSIAVDSLTSIDITPSSSQAVYTGTNSIIYANSCPYGFNVTMSSTTDRTSLTRLGDDSATKEIPSTAETTLTDNTWGVSIDGGSTYKPIPSITAVPVNIINTFEATNNPTTLNLIYGVKTDNSLPSGSYTNDVIYTISVKPQCLTYDITWDLDGGTAASGVTYPTSLNFGQTIDLSGLTPTKEGYEFVGWSNGKDTYTGTETAADINPGLLSSLDMTAQYELLPTMQEFSCSTLLNTGDSIKLRDARDNKEYIVKKLADGRCWMTQNLRLINKEISSVDSNLPEGETWIVPVSSTSGFNEYNENNAYLDSTYGGYYSFYTATAGWGTNSVTSGNSPKDICPKGWRLPVISEYETLYSKYPSTSHLQDKAGFTLSGRVYQGAVDRQGTVGFYASSTLKNAYITYNLYLDDTNVNPVNDSENKSIGLSVRCVADMERMQGFNSSVLSVNESKKLEDIRDGKIYTVKKLADGRVWMTENLRLIDKTISSADSNLPSGVTWTVPASSTSGFNTYNTNNAYLDSAYGGYYTFYTATAGWGTNSVTSGNAPKDICPKGWHLPTGGDSGEFQILYNNYNSSALMQGDPGFVLSGYAGSGSVYNQDVYGYYWSSSVVDASRAYFLGLNSSGVNPTNYIVKSRGFSIRCVANTEKMQDFDSSTLSANESKDLEDIRDGNIYTVKKLADGKVWMTENLRLINKTISSTDSNLPSGTSWTVPESSTSGFTEYNTNSAYLNPTYGGYYTFYTATAGWGTNSVSSGNSSKDICPKGWRLPTGGSSGEYQTLYEKYNSSEAMQGDPGFVISGNVYNGSAVNQGSYGYYWSSTSSSKNNAYILGINSSDAYPTTYNSKNIGVTVRCLAK